MNEVRLSPAWRHALAVLLEQGLPYGRVITKAELAALFGLRDPVTARDMQDFQFRWLREFTAMSHELLIVHRLCLRTMHGESSYEVIAPANQAAFALHEGQRDMARASEKMLRRVAFTRVEELTEEQQKRHADAQAKAAMLAGMVREPRIGGRGYAAIDH